MRDHAAEEDVRQRVAAAVARLPRSRAAYVADTDDRDAGYPFFRVEDGRHLYLARERGRETLRRETDDPDTLAMWVVQDAARQLAIDHEARHRRRGEDSRRQWFARWVALMTRVDPAWGRATQAHVDEVLASHPFRDHA